jgi:hypothetical protein
LEQIEQKIPTLLSENKIGEFESAEIFRLFAFLIEFFVLLTKNDIEFSADLHWTPTFLKLYLDIITDCVVTYDHNEIHLEHINKLVVRKLPNGPYKWEVSIKDKLVYSWEVDLESALKAISTSPINDRRQWKRTELP